MNKIDFKQLKGVYSGTLSASAFVGDGSGLTNIVAAATLSFALGAEVASSSFFASSSVSASYATQASASFTAVSASHALRSVSSSIASTASLAGMVSASGIIGNVTSASYSVTSSFALQARTTTSSSYALSGSYALRTPIATSASFAQTANSAISSTTASFVATASSAASLTFTPASSSTAISSSHAVFANTSRQSFTASLANLALTANTASFATNVPTASFAITASNATVATLALNALTATTASYTLLAATALTASFISSVSASTVRPGTLSGSFGFTASPTIAGLTNDRVLYVSSSRPTSAQFLTVDAVNNRLGINTSTPNFTLEVNGAFAANTKSFIIKHPTKPGLMLQHGVVEGPEHSVYIRGTVSGSDKIYFPEYWKNLVDHTTITVHLTPVGFWSAFHVAEVTEDYVRLNIPNIKAYYYIQATRKDIPTLELELPSTEQV